MATSGSGQLAAEIRAEMARQGETAVRVARAIGLSPATLSRKINGRRELLVTEAAEIAEHLGVSLSELARRAEATLASRDVAS